MLNNLIKAIIIATIFTTSISALEMKAHKQVITNDTTINSDGTHIEN